MNFGIDKMSLEIQSRGEYSSQTMSHYSYIDIESFLYCEIVFGKLLIFKSGNGFLLKLTGKMCEVLSYVWQWDVADENEPWGDEVLGRTEMHMIG